MVNFRTVADVVNHDLCLGCGVCRVVCPENAIEIRYSSAKGQHLPKVNYEKCTSCGLCLKVCSGYEVDHSKLNFEKFGKLPENPFLGNYEELLVAKSKDDQFRANGASGGVVAQLLMNMIDSKAIDAALVVVPNQHDFRSPKMILAKTKEELLQSQGSCYLNAPLGTKLEELLKLETSIALVGLPCLLNSLQKSFKVLPALKNKIKYTIGLFCNGVYSGNAVTEFCERKNIDINNISKVEFRRGNWPGSMKFTYKNGEEEFYKRDKYFHNKYLNRCYYCYDFLADTADISVGDNWLPQNVKASNAVVVRNPGIKNFFNDIEIDELKANDFMESHRLYHSRRRFTAAQLKQGKLHKKVTPSIKPAVKIPLKFWNHLVAWLDWKRANVTATKLPGFMKLRGTILESLIFSRPIDSKYLTEETGNSTLNILITEGDVVGNKGAVAMTNCLIRDISRQLPETKFVITSKHIKKDTSFGKNIRTLYDNGPHFELSLLATGLWFFLKLLGINARSLLNNKIAKAYLDADLVISATGISFIEEFGNKKIYHFSKYLMMPLMLNKKVIKLTQSFGPIQNRYNRFMASALLPRITRVMARGEISRNNLSEAGIVKNVISLPDLAVTMDKNNSDKVKLIMARYNGEKIIGISPNIVCHNLTKDNLYLIEMKKICAHIINEYPDFKIIFIPHTITKKDEGKNDDLWICSELGESLPNERFDILDTVDLSPAELKAIISLSDFFVGSRYHALVAAVSTSTPCLGIGWHYKYNELMAWYKLDQNIVNIWELGKVDISNLFNNCFAEKEQLHNLLLKANPGVKALAAKAAEEIITELKK